MRDAVAAQAAHTVVHIHHIASLGALPTASSDVQTYRQLY